MKLTKLNLFLCCFMTGCSSTREYKPGQDVYETQTSHACVTIKALNALASGNTNHATYLMQVEAFMTAPILLELERKETNIPEWQRQDVREYLRELTGYFENNLDKIDPNLPMTRHCVAALEQMLTTEADKMRIQAIKNKLKDKASNQPAQATGKPAPGR
ncbi:MAG: hypothetical protein WCL49_08790 [bacterium]